MLDVWTKKKISIKGEGSGERGAIIRSDRRGVADDGKRCSSAERLPTEKNIYLRERGSGRGDTIIGPESRGLADSPLLTWKFHVKPLTWNFHVKKSLFVYF